MELKEMLREIAGRARPTPDAVESRTRDASAAEPTGVIALFVGADGTTAERATVVLADELGRDVHRVDLDQVVSKYIDETEKNLRQLFAAAEKGGWILFFDEADALFGKRTDVKDSHDRYANLDVNFLLERLEAYQGLAILATNRKESLDHPFIRRIRHVVSFPDR
jgi:SpoVK/Ycf46/Vps4 family AAA+-type ATPase